MPEQVRLNRTKLDVLSRNDGAVCRNTGAVSALVVSNKFGPAKAATHRMTLSVLSRVTPGIPDNLRQTASTSTTITVDWDASAAGTPPTGYEYKLGESGTVATATKPLTFNIDDPYGSYDIYVRAKTGASTSGWAHALVSPSILTTFAGTRSRKTANFQVNHLITRMTMDVSRRRRTSDIAMEQGIRARIAATRRRRVLNIFFERPTIGVNFTIERARRSSSLNLEISLSNLTLSGTRRRRVSSMAIQRPALDIRPTAFRRRRTSSLGIIFPDQLLRANMSRRRRTSTHDIDSYFEVLSMHDDTTPIQVKHDDGEWRPIRIRPL